MQELILNHTYRAMRQECHRKHLFGCICGLQSIAPEGAGLDFGKSFHMASEDYDKWDSLDRAADVFSENLLLEDKVRTIGRGKELLVAYRKATAQEGLHFQFHEEGIEKPFLVKLTPWLTHAGRLDRELADDAGFAEIKTTYYLYNSSGSPMPFLSSWADHNSIIGYAFYKKFKKCYLVAVCVYPQKHGPHCVIYPIEIFPWRLEEWEEETLRIGEEIFNVFVDNNFEQGQEEENLEKMLSGRLWRKFNKSTNRCNPWPYSNPCKFRDLCLRDVPESLLRSQYVVEPFRPWETGDEG